MDTIAYNSDGSIEVYWNKQKEGNHSAIFAALGIFSTGCAYYIDEPGMALFRGGFIGIAIFSIVLVVWSFSSIKGQPTRAFKLSVEGITIHQQLIKWDDVKDVYVGSEHECVVVGRNSGPLNIIDIYLDLTAPEVFRLIQDFRTKRSTHKIVEAA
ncbi:MAG TPA: hypothetical protein VEK08_04805 [Planctomycetota bacterium]|nr:hypothetical protein [Planctomycetota bacterium]